jgi:hypothetical protein
MLTRQQRRLLFLPRSAAETPQTPTFRASATAQADSADGLVTVSVPTGTAAGDVMVAGIVVISTSATLSPPAGWETIRRSNSGAGLVLETFYKLAEVSEPADYTWITTTEDAGPVIGIIASYSEVNPASPIGVDAGVGYSGLSSPITTAPDATTTVDGCLVLGLYLIQVNTTVSSVGNGQALRDSQATGAGSTLALADLAQTSAGAIGTRTCTFAASTTRNVAQTIALRPV